MFKENDKWLNTIYRLLSILLLIVALVVGILGILLAVLLGNMIYLVFTFLVPVCCLIGWAVLRFFVSYLVDIKLIRNKLYECGNEDLEMYLIKKKPYDPDEDVVAEDNSDGNE